MHYFKHTKAKGPTANQVGPSKPANRLESVYPIHLLYISILFIQRSLWKQKKTNHWNLIQAIFRFSRMALLSGGTQAGRTLRSVVPSQGYRHSDHQLRLVVYHHHLQGFTVIRLFTSCLHPRWCRISEPSTASSILKAAGQGLLAKEILGTPNPKNSVAKQGKLKPYLLISLSPINQIGFWALIYASVSKHFDHHVCLFDPIKDYYYIHHLLHSLKLEVLHLSAAAYETKIYKHRWFDSSPTSPTCNEF